MDTFYLSATPWGKLYQIFNVDSDVSLCHRMTTIGLLYTIVVGVYSILFPAPYGRYYSTSWGPTLGAKQAWVIQELPAFLAPAVLMLSTPCVFLSNWTNAVGLSLFMAHYFHRSFIFPLALSDSAKPTPLLTVLNAFAFCSYNGFLQGHYLLNTVKVESYGYFQIVGLILFILGMGINISHDRMLIKLKTTSTKKNDGESTYKIPTGGVFEYVSGANYFGEILEWWGLACFTRGYPQITFAVFASIFLGTRAYHHHQWYKEKFGGAYPKRRKAVIPFLL